MDPEDIIISLVALLVSIVLTGIQTAYFSVSKLQLEIERSSKNFFSRCLIFCSEKSHYSIFTLRVLNYITFLLYILGIYWGLLSVTSLSFWCVIGIIAIAILLFVFVSIFLPRSIFKLYAYSFWKYFSPIMAILLLLTYPFAWAFWSVVYVIEAKFIKTPSFSSYPNMQSTLETSFDEFCDRENEEQSTEIQMVQNVIDLKKSKVRTCMVPRNEIIQTGINTSISDLTQLFVSTGFSKILIYKEKIENIVGYVHAYDLFQVPLPVDIQKIIRPVYQIPESVTVNTLLKDMIAQHKSIAVVFDEFGSVSGMLTLEDLMEEIFGEIEDEFDIKDAEEQKIDLDTYVFSTRLEVDYLNEKYSLNILESEEYDTLAGFITTKLQRIPKYKEEFVLNNLFIRVLQASDIRVEKVLIKNLKK